MSPKRRHALRTALHHHQDGRCCYCKTKLLMPRGLIWQGKKQYHARAATFEHLRKRQDGGTNHPDNLALACRLCNSSRGDVSWVEFATRKHPTQSTDKGREKVA